MHTLLLVASPTRADSPAAPRPHGPTAIRPPPPFSHAGEEERDTETSIVREKARGTEREQIRPREADRRNLRGKRGAAVFFFFYYFFFFFFFYSVFE